MTAVVLAYGEEPELDACIGSVLASTGVELEVIVVDNGCTDGGVDQIRKRQDARVRVLEPGRNLGYAAGNNLAAREASGEVLVFVNNDAIVEPDALASLTHVATEQTVGLATASVRLADRPDRLNSAGNDIHFTGLSWSGCFDEPAANYTTQRDVAGASGAAMAIRRAVFSSLGGFDEDYFMYYDDTDLSLRAHQVGLRVVFVPSAVVYHRYEFTRNPQKLFLLERNRLFSVLTLYQGRTLLVLAPAALVLEVALLALAATQGWLHHKLRAWWWLIANARTVRAQRRIRQARRTVPDRALAHLFVATIHAANVELPSSVRFLNVALTAYWRVARRLLPGRLERRSRRDR